MYAVYMSWFITSLFLPLPLSVSLHLTRLLLVLSRPMFRSGDWSPCENGHVGSWFWFPLHRSEVQRCKVQRPCYADMLSVSGTVAEQVAALCAALNTLTGGMRIFVVRKVFSAVASTAVTICTDCCKIKNKLHCAHSVYFYVR